MEWDAYILMFRRKDTWYPGTTVFESLEEARKCAERYSGSDAERILIVPAISVRSKGSYGVKSYIR